MINSLHIENFKSIDDFTFHLGKLTILAGPNSAGKSSVIQSLLLASDNLWAKEISHSLVCKHFPAPSFNEVRNYVKNAKVYNVDVNGVEMSFTTMDDAMIKTLVSQHGIMADDDFQLLNQGLLYLPAMRSAEIATSKINIDPDVNPLGLMGEYVMDYYYNHHTDLLPESVLVCEATSETLNGQLNYWLHKLTGYTINVALDGSEYKVRFEAQGRSLHPHHVGTGVSFISAVLIVCLASCIRGGFVVIENPEIHIHPAAQADLIDFIALMTKANVQVLIETHSDHVFNGIRRLLHIGKLNVEDVKVYNFKREDNGNSSVRQIKLSQQGGIVDYEPNLFDQFDKDLDAILS